MTQQRFAELVGVSAVTIRFIEAGRLALSQDLAARIVNETGVNFAWLVQNDPDAPMIDLAGNPYALESQAKAWNRLMAPMHDNDSLRLTLARTQVLCLGVLVSALRSGKLVAASYRIERALESLGRDFGMDESLSSELKDVDLRIGQMEFHEIEAALDSIVSKSIKELLDRSIQDVGGDRSRPRKSKPKRKK